MDKSKFIITFVELWEEYKEQHYFDSDNFQFNMDDFIRWLKAYEIG